MINQRLILKALFIKRDNEISQLNIELKNGYIDDYDKNKYIIMQL